MKMSGVFFLLIINLSSQQATATQDSNAAAASVADTTSENREKQILIDGTLRVRGESAQKTDTSSVRDFFSMRGRVNLTFKPSNKLKVFFQPQYSRILGAAEYIPVSNSANTQTTNSGSNQDSSLSLHQGYFDYLVSDDLSILAGRSSLSFGDELLIGVNDWNNVGRSFDLIKLQWRYEVGKTDLLASAINETNSTASSSGDNSFYGLYNSWTFDSVKNVDLYGFYSRDARNGTPLDLDLWTFGARAKSAMDQFDYRLEATGQSGSTAQVATQDYQFDAETGYKIPSLRVALEGFTASEKYNQLYPTTHKWLGFADVLSRKNITGAGLHTQQSWGERVGTELSYQYFTRTSTNSPAYKFNGQPLGIAQASSSKDVGSEIDLTVRYKASENFTIQLGASVFFAGAYLNDQLASMTPVFFYVQTEANF